jgi:hypothetical protein
MDNGEAQPSKRQKLDESVEVNTSSPSIPRTRNKKRKHEEGFQPFDYSKVNFNGFQGDSIVSVTHRNEGEPRDKKIRCQGKNS